MNSIEVFFKSLLRTVAKLDFTSVGIKLAGLPFRIHFSSAELSAGLLPALAHLPSFGAENTKAFDIWAWGDGDKNRPIANWSLQDYGTRSKIETHCNQEFLTTHQADQDLWSCAQYSAQRGFFWAPNPATLPYYERAAPFRLIFNHLLQRVDRYPIHAACVGSDGLGLLITGPGGSGKSNTALTCLRNGMAFLSEDYCIVELRGPEVIAWSQYCSLKLHERDIELCHINHVNQKAGEKRLFFLHPSTKLTNQLKVKAIVLPRVTGQNDATLSQASPAEALLALSPSTLFQLPGRSQTSFHAMSRLVRAVPAFHLSLGSRESAVDVLRELLNQLRGANICK